MEGVIDILKDGEKTRQVRLQQLAATAREWRLDSKTVQSSFQDGRWSVSQTYRADLSLSALNIDGVCTLRGQKAWEKVMQWKLHMGALG